MATIPPISQLEYSKTDAIKLSGFPAFAVPNLPLTGDRIVPSLGRHLCFEAEISPYLLRVDLISAYDDGQVQLSNTAENPSLLVNLYHNVDYQDARRSSIRLERYSYCFQQQNKTMSSLFVKQAEKYAFMTLVFPQKFMDPIEHWQKHGQPAPAMSHIFGKVASASHTMIGEIHKLMACSFPAEIRKTYLGLIATALLIDGMDKIVNHRSDIDGH